MKRLLFYIEKQNVLMAIIQQDILDISMMYTN